MMGVNAIQLTSKSHHDNILTSLHQFRLQGQLNDVTVQIDHQGDVQDFMAHQVILAASSGYFRKALLSKDATQDRFLLSNMQYHCFSKFLEFVYTGKVEITRDEIADVLAAAQFLDCQDLAEVCGEAMSAGILQNPPKKTSAAEVADKDDLHGAKKENQTEGKKQPESPKRLLSPQSAEKEVISKRCVAKKKVTGEKRPGKRVKLRARRKVLPRHLNTESNDVVHDYHGSNKDTEEDEEERGEPGPQPQNQAEEGEEPLLEMPPSDMDDWEREEDEQSNETDDILMLTLDQEEQAHWAKRTSTAQFQCNKCQRTFHYERSYLKHISTYHGVKADVIYRCETCLQTFANRSNLKIHEKHVHSTERLFSCISCSKTFKRKKDVVRHQRQVHDRNNLRHVCHECGKTLSSKTALLLHERTHTGAKPFQCTDCGAKFTQNSALKMHHRTHTGEKPFACDKCDARFTQKHMLTYHKRSHTGEKPFMCEECGKSFASKEYLRHHSNIHTGSRPYKCTQCGRGFAQRNSLHQHLKIHTGERPYSCKDCDKQFTQLNALQRHQRIHTGEKPYMCGLCSRTFTDKSTLRRHAKIHDSNVPWKTYLVVLEGNVEDKKPAKGKSEKAGAGEKKSATRKSAGAADADTSLVSASKIHTESIVVPAEPVILPSDWTTHGTIALVSHGAAGGITVIHTEMPHGTQIQPIVTTDGTSVISLDGSAIPFAIPVSMAHPIPLSTEVSTTSLSVPTFSVPVSNGTLVSISEIPVVSASSVPETAPSQTSSTPVSETKANGDKLSDDIHIVIVDDKVH